MEIAVYAARDFANEETIICKCKSIYYKRGKEDKKSDNIDFDKSTPTTLMQLYLDGWRLVSLSAPFSNVQMFFMEKA